MDEITISITGFGIHKKYIAKKKSELDVIYEDIKELLPYLSELLNARKKIIDFLKEESEGEK